MIIKKKILKIFQKKKNKLKNASKIKYVKNNNLGDTC